jgi:hypothetical protein
LDSRYKLESPKFCRHAGVDPGSGFIIILESFWIPAFAGMTLRMNQHQEYQCVKRTLDCQDIKDGSAINKFVWYQFICYEL